MPCFFWLLLLGLHEFESELEEVFRFVFTPIPTVAFLELNADVICDRLALAVFDPAYKFPTRVFQVDKGVNLNASVHLNAGSRYGNIVQSRNLIMDRALFVYPANFQQIRALIPNVLPFFSHTGIIDKFRGIG